MQPTDNSAHIIGIIGPSHLLDFLEPQIWRRWTKGSSKINQVPRPGFGDLTPYRKLSAPFFPVPLFFRWKKLLCPLFFDEKCRSPFFRLKKLTPPFYSVKEVTTPLFSLKKNSHHPLFPPRKKSHPSLANGARKYSLIPTIQMLLHTKQVSSPLSS